MQTFRDFMESALYEPGSGFYSRRTPTEDFYTAPELHPAFAGVLARALADRLDALQKRGVPGPYCLVEMGAGSGRLAREILQSLRSARSDWAAKAQYIVVERVTDSLVETVVSLSAVCDRVLGYGRVEDVPPCAGVFFSNELVDSFPVHLLEKRGGQMYEVYVEESGRMLLSGFSTKELAPHAEAVAAGLAEGERHAVNLEALRWLRAVSERLTAGFLLTVDYGKRFQGAPNPPRTFFRHATDDRLAEAKGLKDITASVDFDSLIAEGGRCGLKLESYGTLSRFLIDGGVSDWLKAGEDAAAWRSRAKIKTLIHPEGMGEVFKVLVQGRTAALPG